MLPPSSGDTEHGDVDGPGTGEGRSDRYHCPQQDARRQALAGRLETRGLTDGYVVDNKFLPGQSTGWHSHPGPSLIFVVSGSVTNYDSDAPGCAGVTYTAGTSFIDAGGTNVHMLRDDGTVPAETIAVQFIPSGQPRRIDQPVVPDGCSP